MVAVGVIAAVRGALGAEPVKAGYVIVVAEPGKPPRSRPFVYDVKTACDTDAAGEHLFGRWPSGTRFACAPVKR